MNPRSHSQSTTAPTEAGDDLQMVSFKLSTRHREWLRVEAFRRRSTKTDILRDLLDAAIAEKQEGHAA